MYINQSIQKYIDDLSARKPVPGGGSAGALCGAIGVGLLQMVCNFTIGSDEHKNIQKDLEVSLGNLETIKADFMSLVDDDVEIYNEIRKAFKSKDKKIIDNSLKQGYYICLKLCKSASKALCLAVELGEKGSAKLITDVGCGAEALMAAFNAGIFNCKINLKDLKDPVFLEQELSVLSELVNKTRPLYEEAIKKTNERMK